MQFFLYNNRILRALITLPTIHYEILGLVSKYGIYTVHYSIQLYPLRLQYGLALSAKF